MDSPELIHGSCNCGNIKVSLPRASLPPKISLCHCTSCRASSGSLFSVNIRVPAKDISITAGTPKVYVTKADSRNVVHRFFCGDCGSPVMSKVENSSELASLKGGLFAAFGVDLPPPGRHVYWARAEKWEVPGEGVEIFE